MKDLRRPKFDKNPKLRHEFYFKRINGLTQIRSDISL